MPFSEKQRKTKHKLLRRMQKKLWIVFLIVCILFIMLIGRIMYIQYTSGGRYEKQVLSQMNYESAVIPYKRGDITDTNGTIIATSVDVYSMILDSYILSRQSEESIEECVYLIRSCFPEISEESIYSNLRDNPDSRYIPLLKEISHDSMTEFLSMAENVSGGGINGIWFEKSYLRIYPYDSLAADVIGFTSGEGMGAIGLENGYNRELIGINGRRYVYLDEANTERRTENPRNGNSIVTTLDINIQSIVEEEIRRFDISMSGEGVNGSLETAALVMDPRNGEILAIADYPTFDLNNPRDLSAMYTPEELEVMSSDEKMKILNTLWQNFAISHTYEPGSTFKPFTVACGLETGALTGEEVYICDGGEHIDDWDVKCVNVYGHGQVSVEDALAESCNDALMQMSYKIGAHNFAYYQRLFGFGQRTNVDITGEARTDRVIFSEEDLNSTINLATNSFGQNFNVTMIQLASAFSSLVNGGYLYEPHVVKSIVDSSGNVMVKKNSVMEKVTISKATGEQIKGYLKNVVVNGTGNKAGVEGYSIGGKTGTAEKLPRGQGKYLVSFIGFAPVESPQVLVYIVVDEPNTDDQAHSSYAQEIAHNIFAQILPYLNIDMEVAGISPGDISVFDYSQNAPKNSETEEAFQESAGDMEPLPDTGEGN